jgi:glycosyltransferase involved in cell wall biosynthesis
MKIAFVNQPFDMVFPPCQNSLGIWTYEVARGLTHSCDVIVYSRGNQSPIRAEYDEAGVQYRNTAVGADQSLVKLISPLVKILPTKSPLFASSLYYMMYALKVALDLRKQQCDIVHIFNYSQFAPIIRALNSHVKIVLHMHCEWLTQLDHAMIKRRLEKVDMVVGVSEYISEKIRKRFPPYAKLCRTVFNGVDTVRFSGRDGSSIVPKNRAKQILFVGRISPEKGLHVLLDAFRKVTEHHPGVCLQLVGPRQQLSREMLLTLTDEETVSHLISFSRENSRISYFSQLQEHVASLNLKGRVVFADFVPYSDIVGYYRNAYVVVNPSFSEAFGRSLIEAMACEVPVVATRVGGMKEIVEDGVTGFLVESGDADALADAILLLMNNQDLQDSMGKCARERAVELFSWQRVSHEILTHYEDILRPHD